VVNGSLVWNNGAEVCTGYFRRDYWVEATTVATISGLEYNSLAEVIGTYRSNHSSYQVFTVLSSKAREAGETGVVIPSNTCSDFVWAVFGEMKSRGYLHDRPGPMIPPKNSYAALYLNDTVPPERISVSDPKEKAAVVAFYQKISTVLSDLSRFRKGIIDKLKTVEALVKLLFQLELHTFYVYVEEDSYMKLQLNRTKCFRLEILDIGHIFRG